MAGFAGGRHGACVVDRERIAGHGDADGIVASGRRCARNVEDRVARLDVEAGAVGAGRREVVDIDGGRGRVTGDQLEALCREAVGRQRTGDGDIGLTVMCVILHPDPEAVVGRDRDIAERYVGVMSGRIRFVREGRNAGTHGGRTGAGGTDRALDNRDVVSNRPADDPVGIAIAIGGDRTRTVDQHRSSQADGFDAGAAGVDIAVVVNPHAARADTAGVHATGGMPDGRHIAIDCQIGRAGGDIDAAGVIPRDVDLADGDRGVAIVTQHADTVDISAVDNLDTGATVAGRYGADIDIDLRPHGYDVDAIGADARSRNRAGIDGDIARIGVGDDAVGAIASRRQIEGIDIDIAGVGPVQDADTVVALGAYPGDIDVDIALGFGVDAVSGVARGVHEATRHGDIAAGIVRENGFAGVARGLNNAAEDIEVAGGRIATHGVDAVRQVACGRHRIDRHRYIAAADRQDAGRLCGRGCDAAKSDGQVLGRYRNQAGRIHAIGRQGRRLTGYRDRAARIDDLQGRSDVGRRLDDLIVAERDGQVLRRHRRNDIGYAAGNRRSQTTAIDLAGNDHTALILRRSNCWGHKEQRAGEAAAQGCLPQCRLFCPAGTLIYGIRRKSFIDQIHIECPACVDNAIMGNR